MKCMKCNKTFKDGMAVLPVLRYVENEKRGDFVTSHPNKEYIHALHVITDVSNVPH